MPPKRKARAPPKVTVNTRTKAARSSTPQCDPPTTAFASEVERLATDLMKTQAESIKALQDEVLLLRKESALKDERLHAVQTLRNTNRKRHESNLRRVNYELQRVHSELATVQLQYHTLQERSTTERKTLDAMIKTQNPKFLGRALGCLKTMVPNIILFLINTKLSSGLVGHGVALAASTAMKIPYRAAIQPNARFPNNRGNNGNQVTNPFRHH